MPLEDDAAGGIWARHWPLRCQEGDQKLLVGLYQTQVTTRSAQHVVLWCKKRLKRKSIQQSQELSVVCPARAVQKDFPYCNLGRVHHITSQQSIYISLLYLYIVDHLWTYLYTQTHVDCSPSILLWFMGSTLTGRLHNKSSLKVQMQFSRNKLDEEMIFVTAMYILASELSLRTVFGVSVICHHTTIRSL